MKLFRLLFTARSTFPRVLPLMRDARVPMWLKVAVALVALVFVSPLDPLSDIPLIGLIDDAAILLFLANAFVWLAERLLREPAGSTVVRPERRVAPIALGGADAS